VNKIEYKYIDKWWTMEDLKKHLESLTNDEDKINEIMRDILKYAKVRYSVEK